MTRLGPTSRVLLALALLVTVAACGLDEETSPKDIAVGDVPAELLDPNPSSSTSVAGLPNAAVTVYYLVLQDGATRLVPVSRAVAEAASPASRISALLTPPTAEEQASGITTSIPAGTRLLRTELIEDERVLTIDLSSSIFDVQGAELRNAFAQLVWTATDVETVSRVQFEVDGEEYRVPDDAGVEQPSSVGRADYDALKPVA
jgi:spore germination protein GerM